MSLRHSTPEMIAENLPRKGAARIDTTGLQKRPQFEQILNYLTYGQENIVFPDREAKLVRNHPFMTQLDFFDMQEDQKNQWEEQKRQQEIEVIAEKFGMSAASVRAMGTQTGKTQTSNTQSQTNGTQNASSGTQTDGTQNTSSGTQPGKRTNTGGTQTERASSSTQHPVYTVYNDSRVSGTHPSMQGGVSYRPTVPTVPHFKDGWQGPGSSSGPPPPATVAAAAVASTLALQEQGITDTVTHMDMDARKRLSEAKEQIGTRRQVMQQKVDAMLAQPVPQAAAAPLATKPVYDQQMDPAALKRSTGDEGEGARVKRQVQQHTGEIVNHIAFLNTSADVMDARATAMQENARIAEIAIVDTVTNNSSDFDGLANALGETVPHEVIPVVSTPQQFNIGTPRERERSPRGRGKGRGGKNTVSGALAAIAAEKQIVPENVDAGIAPIARKRTGKGGKNTVSGALATLAVGRLSAPGAGNLAIEDGEPPKKQIKRAAKQQTLNDVGFSGKAPKVINKLQQKEKDKSKQTKIKDAFAKSSTPKAIALPDAPRATEKAPKLENSTSEENVVENDWVKLWKDLDEDQIIMKIQKEFKRHKNEATLEKMKKQTLLSYVDGLMKAREKKAANAFNSAKVMGQRNRTARVK